MTHGKPRAANIIDVKVGEALRLARTVKKWSQEKLGDEVGVTFQQIQKYERGANRIGASRLWKLAEVLDVPISDFFSGVGSEIENNTAKTRDDLMNLSQSAYGLKMATAVNNIKSKSQRTQLLALARAMGGEHLSP